MKDDKNKDYLNWDDTFMLMADLVSKRSKDPNTQTGACIVDEDKVIVGVGYNGFPRGCNDNDLPWCRSGKSALDVKYTYVVHAEANAVMNSNASVRGCILYCTLFPCNECAKVIIQNGIKEVVYKDDTYKDLDIFKASRKMLEMAGVILRQYTPEHKIEIKKNKK
ncbi:cytidine/deoxycytidylate deaminase family protein [Patescibacteria group bacterium]